MLAVLTDTPEGKTVKEKNSVVKKKGGKRRLLKERNFSQ
jgi:hypothetical protein